MALKCQALRPDLNLRVVSLFPTLKDFPECAGPVIPWLIRPWVREPLVLTLFALGWLPSFATRAILNGLQPKLKGTHAEDTTHALAFSSSHVRNVLYLARSEHASIIDVDWPAMKRANAVFLFGQKDQWGPIPHYEEFREVLGPAKVFLDEAGMPHDFVIKDSEAMARRTATFIDPSKEW